MSTFLDGFVLTDLTEDHLKSLRLLRISEGPSIEYKRELKMGSDSEKKELCKDVTALAHTQGGYIFFGISEVGAIPAEIAGISYDAKTRDQLHQVLSSGVSPRLQYCQEFAIALSNGSSVLVLKVSVDGALHQVKYNDNRSYKRVGTITVPMESFDLETFFKGQGSLTREEQVCEVTKTYHAALKGRKYFRGVGDQGIIALTIVPDLPSFKLDIGNLPDNFTSLLGPIYSSGWSSATTGRSRLIYCQHRDHATPDAVTEITERGEIKAYNSTLLENRFGDDKLPEGCIGYIPCVAYERELIRSVHQYLNSLQELGISLPCFLQLALLGVRGYIMYVGGSRLSRSSRIYTDEDILPDPIHVTDESQFRDYQPVAKLLQPTFNYIWREFGFERSYNYDLSGEWRGI